MKDIVRRCLGKVIISCQAYEDTPLYGAQYMKAMAQCALKGGAEVIRACWKQDIAAIRSLGDFPIIGLNKVIDPDKRDQDYIIITPTLESAREVIEAGCDILALDCTLRPCRGKKELLKLLQAIHAEYPQTALMADIDTLEEGLYAASTGLIDIVSTTLSGRHYPGTGPDIELVRQLKQQIDLPVNAEGRIWELKDLKDVLDAGADMTTIGTAVTRPHLITERFVQYNDDYRTAGD